MSCNDYLRSIRHWRWMGVVGLVLLLLSGCANSAPATVSPSPTPAAPKYTRLDLGIPPAALNAPIVGTVPASTVLHVSVTFKINQQLLNSMNTQVVKAGQTQDVSSLANRIGISEQTYQQVKAFFGIENATLHLNSLHTNLTIDAKASTFARLLQTRFVIHRLDGRTFFTPDPNALPVLPTVIANQIEAITGLDNHSMPPHGSALKQTDSSQVTASGSQQTKPDCSFRTRYGHTYMTPSMIAHVYGYDQFYRAGYNGEGMTINLVESDGLNASDLQNYFACVHYRGKLSMVMVNKQLTPATTNGEAQLDVDMIAGLAPAANIVDYQTDLTNVNTYDDVWTRYNDALQLMINNNLKNGGSGSVVSISLGVTEGLITRADLQAMDQSLQILTKVEHMTVFVASSDCGAYDGASEGGPYGTLAVSFPASDPSVVAVGGTMVPIDPTSHQMLNTSESVWSDNSDHSVCNNSWGSGGGLSQVFKRPSWQTGPGVQNRYSNGARQLPDIAAYAFILMTYGNGKWEANGGTSAATPIWASGMALLNEALMHRVHGFYVGPQLFYGVAQLGVNEHLQPYHDITKGNNLYYPATSGYDLATGFGSPNLPVMYTILYRASRS